MKPDVQQSLLRNGLHFLLVGIIAAAVEFVVAHEFRGNKFIALAMMFTALQLLGIYLVFLISRRLDEISHRVGIRTTLVPYPQAYQELEKATRSAEEEILIVSNWTLEYQVNEAAELDRQRYFESLLAKAKQAGVIYERVAQMSESAEEMVNVFTVLIPHLRECIKARDSNLANIGLFRCKPMSLVSFTLIDSKFLLLQLDELKNKRYQVSQAVIIEDDSGKVTSVFRKMFDNLKRKSDSIKMEELMELETLFNTLCTKASTPGT
jgi:hypothetical protein